MIIVFIVGSSDVGFGDEEAILYHLNFLQRINLKLDQMPKA